VWRITDFPRISNSPHTGQHHPIVTPGANEAEAALPLLELAEARTEIALNPAVRERMPEARLKTFLDGAHL
jgi:hypothetical protein